MSVLSYGPLAEAPEFKEAVETFVSAGLSGICGCISFPHPFSVVAWVCSKFVFIYLPRFS